MNLRAIPEALEARRMFAISSPLPVVNLSWEDTAGPALQDRWIVRLGGYEGTQGSQLKKARRLLGDASEQVEVRQYLIDNGLFSVQLHNDLSAKQQYEMLSALPGFVSAEPDWIYSTDATPNDTNFASLWGMNNGSDTDIDAPEAWNITTGSMANIVGIIDSGVDYTHRDLAQNIYLNNAEIPTAIRSLLVDIDGDGIITFRDLNNATNQGAGKITDLNANGRIDGGDLLNNASGWENGVDDDANGLADDLVGWNFLSNNNDPMDVFSHGTHVAGTVGAVGNNSLDVVGVNWRVSILPLKSGGLNGSDNTISLAAAVASTNYATNLRTRGENLRSINNSWGGLGFSSEMFAALNFASNVGIMAVNAAGNGGADSVGDNNDAVPHYPSSYELPNVIAVLNLTSSGVRSSDSNFGATSVDLGAPGTSILSTVPGGTAFFSGTSMASPHVAGAVALLFQQYPNLTLPQARQALLETVDPVTSIASNTVSGGRLNLFRAITAFELAPLGAPDLDAASDTGFSATDNITRDTTPTFTGSTTPGNTVRVFLNNVLRGTATANASGVWTVTTGALANGTYSVVTTVSDGTLTSLRSSPSTVVIDTVAPSITAGTFPQNVSPQQLQITYNENVGGGFETNDAIVTNLTTGQTLDSATFAFDVNTPTNTINLRFPGQPSSIVPQGNYTVSVQSNDAAGNAMTSPFNFTFWILYGDSNRDRMVNLSDFAQMSANFGQSPRSFGQGDYNFDGIVNISDFSLLAANFNTSLPAPGDLPRSSNGLNARFSNELIRDESAWSAIEGAGV